MSKNKVLLIVDIQNGFTKRESTKDIPKKIKDLIHETNYFNLVIATMFINKPHSPFTEILNWHGMMEYNDITLCEGIEKLSNVVFAKEGYNSYTREVADYFRKFLGEIPEEIYLVGVDTECCVLATAIEVFSKNIKPIVLTEYCASGGGEEKHLAGINSMERLIGKDNLVHDFNEYLTKQKD